MATAKITFLPHNLSIDAPRGSSVIQAALEAGVHINASCGGEGVCGKCRVRVEEGQVTDGVSEKLSPEDIQKGYRLACRSAVVGDLTVRIPVESAIDPAVLNRPASPRRSARIRKFNFEELKERGLFLAPVEKKFLQIPPPSPSDNLPDLTRLIGFLKLQHDEHKLEADISVIRKIPAVIRQDPWRCTDGSGFLSGGPLAVSQI